MPAPLYGATFELVKKLLPHRRWVAGSGPEQGDVESYIASVAGGLVLPALDAADPRSATLETLAQRVIVLGAASHAEAGAMPERANPEGTSSYAQWLWDRYEDALAVLMAFVDKVESEGVDLGAGVGEPAWHFPDPVDWAARGF